MDKCSYCSKDLSKVQELQSVEGLLFCSQGCAIKHKQSDGASFEEAVDWFCDHAESVTPEDIGIKTEES